MNSILLIGQSNMCGRGIIGSVPAVDPQGRIFMLRNGRWQIMSEPVNPDRVIFVDKPSDFRSGISLAPSFAERYIQTFGGKIGLIPCADGDTEIAEWQPGEILFDHAVMMTELAQRTSQLQGILWHQGENDADSIEKVQAYEKQFFHMIDALLNAVSDGKEIPVVIGELSTKVPNVWRFADKFNKVLHKIALQRDNIGVVSSEGLDIGPDGIHFTGESYREFGRRYFDVYEEIVRKISARETPVNP